MNERERFLATMHYQPRDRAPICDFGFWPETIVLWKEQGLPDWVGGGHDTTTTNEFFGMDRYGGGPAPQVKLVPAFEQKVLEDRGDHVVEQQADGVRVLRRKFMSSIPVHEGHLLVDRASWNQHYKPRLDPNTPARYPANWAAAMKVWTDPHRPNVCNLSAGSLYGWIRDWMGLENVSMVVYDDPAFFQEMVETIADCVIQAIRRPLEAGAKFDACSMWEDMCYNSGPLLSPQHFKQFLVPHYRRITDLLHQYGIDIIWLDCDGKIDDLIPMWLDAGVNCMFPIEIGTWGADPVKYRRQYGRELLMMGGFDKHILARSAAEIEAEVNRLAPLVEEGGFIPFCDHRVPPDVPLANYMHYLRTARRVWGRNVNLKPLGELNPRRA